MHNLETDRDFTITLTLLTLLQIWNIVERADLRSELLQELARQKLVMEALKGNPAIASAKQIDIG